LRRHVGLGRNIHASSVSIHASRKASMGRRDFGELFGEGQRSRHVVWVQLSQVMAVKTVYPGPDGVLRAVLYAAVSRPGGGG
jgi:hypothetical protein